MTRFVNYGYQIEVGVKIGDRTYTYIIDVNDWSLNLQHKKFFNFRDLNKLKKTGRLVISRENI